jgi:hypothetical protein
MKKGQVVFSGAIPGCNFTAAITGDGDKTPHLSIKGFHGEATGNVSSDGLRALAKFLKKQAKVMEANG